ncbi:MAG: hypothetical protein O7A08_00055 [SAR324 cluster bacterium]|nr:hypothetical protein [SAR324 cluster bacterium]MCZ6531335.1 hypothetical protein [SAR324 cluster bacterium]MCZ6647029.1 hypothetical protein [SAR324 cluster bacterium]MCZ6728379.1 hypothetical protein [SAR324 cluster bacterium]MCZ6844144.1 hypothetical protein [SAR324 cluster bacterium]
MSRNESTARVLIYSHDRFGLGHLRRSLAIAHGMVGAFQNLSVLIISGSPIIGSFNFKEQVDFVRIPGVIRPPGGELTPLNLRININQAMAIRSSIIEHTANVFQPDLFLVDNVPVGLRGEIRKTLKMLKRRGAKLVLGLRDVIDNPMLLREDWEQLKVLPVLKNAYDQIWVYGLPEICRPLEGLNLPESVLDKVTYTGYLRRELPAASRDSVQFRPAPPSPYIVVTPGGGSDGDGLIDWVLRAYESEGELGYNALVVFGPFMSERMRDGFLTRINCLESVQAITFDTHVEHLLADAAGVVTMGGYNTFCEILSLDKKSIIVPRAAPKIEQFIRGQRAEQLGLAKLLSSDGPKHSALMADAIRNLKHQQYPSLVDIPGMLDGIDNINRMLAEILDERPIQAWAL